MNPTTQAQNFAVAALSLAAATLPTETRAQEIRFGVNEVNHGNYSSYFVEYPQILADSATATFGIQGNLISGATRKTTMLPTGVNADGGYGFALPVNQGGILFLGPTNLNVQVVQLPTMERPVAPLQQPSGETPVFQLLSGGGLSPGTIGLLTVKGLTVGGDEHLEEATSILGPWKKSPALAQLNLVEGQVVSTQAVFMGLDSLGSSQYFRVTSERPTIAVARGTEANTVTLTFTTPDDGWKLQSAPGVTGPWQTRDLYVPDGKSSVTLNVDDARELYRLKK
jgi:hypothetical protein